MSNEAIVALIDAEIAKLRQVRALLATTGNAEVKATAHLKKQSLKTGKKVGVAKVGRPKKAGKPKKRVLSAEARKRIADAQHKRWAAVKAKR